MSISLSLTYKLPSMRSPSIVAFCQKLGKEGREISANQKSNRRCVRCPALHRLLRFARPSLASFFLSDFSHSSRRYVSLSDSAASALADGITVPGPLASEDTMVAVVPDRGATRSSGRFLSSVTRWQACCSRVYMYMYMYSTVSWNCGVDLYQHAPYRDTRKMQTQARGATVYCCDHATNEA